MYVGLLLDYVLISLDCRLSSIFCSNGRSVIRKSKRNSTDIVIDSFIKRSPKTVLCLKVNPSKTAKVHHRYLRRYRGINRMILPAGEYMTKNQLNKYTMRSMVQTSAPKGYRMVSCGILWRGNYQLNHRGYRNPSKRW